MSVKLTQIYLWIFDEVRFYHDEMFPPQFEPIIFVVLHKVALRRMKREKFQAMLFWAILMKFYQTTICVI